MSQSLLHSPTSELGCVQYEHELLENTSHPSHNGIPLTFSCCDVIPFLEFGVAEIECFSHCPNQNNFPNAVGNK
jgi:hypothetical protein